MKKYLYTIFILFAGFWGAFSQNLTKAETAYRQGDFAGAKTEYQKLLPVAGGTDLLQAQLRLAACEYSLGEFLNAATTMQNYPLPQDPVWQARYLLYRIHMGKSVIQNYRDILQPNEISTDSASKDPKQWTQTQWRNQITQDYHRLWELRTSLLEAPIEQESLILNLQDTDTKRIPTLFDFTVNHWINYLRENTSLPARPVSAAIPRYLEGNARLKEGSQKETALLISQLLEEAASLEGKNRQNAKLFWKTDFILLPFNTNFFVLENDSKALQNAQVQLETLSDLSTQKTWWKQLKKAFSALPDYGRSYVAWKLAELLSKHDQFATALTVCQQAQEMTPSYFTQSCDRLTQDIKRVELYAQPTEGPINRLHARLNLTGKNLTKVFVRVYPSSFEELTSLYKSHAYRGTINSWSSIFQLDSQDIPSFLTRQHMHAQTVAVPNEGIGKAQKTSFELPTLAPGVYVVLMATQENFDPEKSPIYAWVLNATDLALFATAAISANPEEYTAVRSEKPKTLHPDVFHIYTINLRTGEPQPNALLQLITQWNGTQEKVSTNKQGYVDLARSVIVSAKERAENTSHTLDVFAKAESSIAYLNNRLFFHFYNAAPIKLFAQTDRPIYRPGQQVQLSVQAFEQLPRGFKTAGNFPVKFQVEDPNGKRIFNASKRLDNLGNAQASFALPENSLLGVYHISVSLTADDRTYQTYHSFRQEEYKRPDYELTLNQPEKALEYGKKALLSGSAQYYFGAPLEKAKVTYTVKRRPYRPPFYWWWFRPLSAEEKIVLHGETSTNDNGQFSIPFTPARQEEDEEFASYVLDVQVSDESGRVITANRTYKVSAHPHLFRVNFTQGFYDANQEATLADIDLTDSEGNSVSGKVDISIVRLENRQPKQPQEDTCYNCERTLRLEQLYQDFAAQKTVLKQTLSFTAKAQPVQLPALSEGVYRLELQSEKAAKQQMIFVVAQENSSLLLPDVALVQQKTYYPGETLRVLVGAGDLKGSKEVEIYQQGRFLTHRARLGGGVQIFSMLLTATHRGGIGLRWFGASNYLLHTAQASVEVPFDNKQLQVDLRIPPYAKPGEKTNWPVTVSDATGSAVNGLLNVTVYDKSLDYYEKNTPFMQFNNLYSQHTGTAETSSSRTGMSVSSYNQSGRSIPPQPELPSLTLPSLNLQMPWHVYSGGRILGGGLMQKRAGARDMLMAAAPPVEIAMAVNQEASFSMKAVADVQPQTEEAAGENANPELRTDFSETAFFNPALPVTGGKASLQFTLPQSLTAWNVLGLALTANADLGAFTASTITRKDLMVRLQMPRFYRETDRGTIQAAVTNQTDKKINARVTLSIQKENADALTAFGVTHPVKTVAVPAGATHFVDWEITAPSDPALYAVTAVVRAGNESDGEQKTLPVLPGKTRLLASVHTALKNGTNRLQLNEISQVPAKDIELLSLKLNPSLALSVLNSMPQLLASPYKDLVSSLNRYVPLAVVHKFYTTYPQLKQAVSKLPKRTGLTASWNENDPLRLQLLEQTPWLWQAQGRQARQADIINLFDEKNVSSTLKKELTHMARFQNQSGAFAWFAGGQDDDYLTLYALSSFAQALAYQADIPQEMAQKAITYIVPRIENRLKKDKTGSVQNVAYALYAAYTLCAFPAHWAPMANAKPYIKQWVDYADAQFKFMTPLGQIYAANVYHQLGDDVKANKYLDLVLSRLKEDPLTGAYFAPEAQSWIWYNDTLSTQTVTLRTLLQMRPLSDKIDSMTQWILFNRQVNDWTDSKAVSQAVFTLLDVMQTKGALSAPSSYQINWAEQSQKLSFEPFDWTENLQFIRTGSQITPQAYSAAITKQSAQTDFASLTAVYQAAQATASDKGVINVKRAYFLRLHDNGEIKLRPLTQLDSIHTADEIEVHLTVDTDSAFEYVFLRDPKPAGFESADLLSGWNYSNVSFYREVKDAATHFFLPWVPRGTFTLRYILRPST
ncbi:MAG: hypothetical protein IKO35_00940, partial [Elusimicrobiaceae bacterium]|nr:hypothetical protein [Elusimicrobiaceae bacterium]